MSLRSPALAGRFFFFFFFFITSATWEALTSIRSLILYQGQECTEQDIGEKSEQNLKKWASSD